MADLLDSPETNEVQKIKVKTLVLTRSNVSIFYKVRDLDFAISTLMKASDLRLKLIIIK